MTFWITDAKLKKLNLKHWMKCYLFGFVAKDNMVYQFQNESYTRKPEKNCLIETQIFLPVKDG